VSKEGTEKEARRSLPLLNGKRGLRVWAGKGGQDGVCEFYKRSGIDEIRFHSSATRWSRRTNEPVRGTTKERTQGDHFQTTRKKEMETRLGGKENPSDSPHRVSWTERAVLKKAIGRLLFKDRKGKEGGKGKRKEGAVK